MIWHHHKPIVYGKVTLDRVGSITTIIVLWLPAKLQHVVFLCIIRRSLWSPTVIWRNNGLLDTLTYGNGAVVDYDYDSDHRVIAKRINSVLKYDYAYDHQGNLARTVEYNGTSTVTTTYVYDFLNRLTKMVSSNGNTLNYHYDTYGRVDVLTNRLGASTYTHSYVYGDTTKEGEIPGLIYTVKLNGSTRLSYDFDQLARLSSRME